MGFGKPNWNKIHKDDVRNRKRAKRAEKRREQAALESASKNGGGKGAAAGMEVDSVGGPVTLGIEEKALAAAAKKLAFRKPRGLSGKKQKKVRQAARLQSSAGTTAAERARKAKTPKAKRGAMEVD